MIGTTLVNRSMRVKAQLNTNENLDETTLVDRAVRALLKNFVTLYTKKDKSRLSRRIPSNHWIHFSSLAGCNSGDKE